MGIRSAATETVLDAVTTQVPIPEAFLGDTIVIAVFTAPKAAVPVAPGFVQFTNYPHPTEPSEIVVLTKEIVLADVADAQTARPAENISLSADQAIRGVALIAPVIGVIDTGVPVINGHTVNYGNSFSPSPNTALVDGSFALDLALATQFPRNLNVDSPAVELEDGWGPLDPTGSGIMIGREVDAGTAGVLSIRSRDPDNPQANDSDAVHGTLFAYVGLMFKPSAAANAIKLQGDVDVNPVIDITTANQVAGGVVASGSFLPVVYDATVTARLLIGAATYAQKDATIDGLDWTVIFPGVAPGTFTFQATVNNNMRSATKDHSSVVTMDREIPIVLSANVVSDEAVEGAAIGTITATPLDADDSGQLTLIDSAGGRFRYTNISQGRFGELAVNNPALIDAGQASSHTVTLRYTDGIGVATEQDFSISVLDENVTPPAPGPAPAPTPTPIDVVAQPIPTRPPDPLPVGAPPPWPVVVTRPPAPSDAMAEDYSENALDPKYRDELLPYTVDFADELNEGETVAYADRELIVRGAKTGDSRVILNVDNMLVGLPFINSGRFVTQWLIGGQPGYAYTMRFKITTSTNRSLYAELGLRVYSSTSQRTQRLDR